MIDDPVLGRIQCPWKGYKTSDSFHHAKKHGLKLLKYPNYMWMFRVSTCKCPDYGSVEVLAPEEKVFPTDGSKAYLDIKHWIWLNPDLEDPRGPKHTHHCPRPYSAEWNYCLMHDLHTTQAMVAHQAQAKAAV